MLSSDNGDDLPPPPSDEIHPSYPWIQMALPGGGIVSVPLERASTSSSVGKRGPGSDLMDDDLHSPNRGSLMQPTMPSSSAAAGATSSAGGIPVVTSSATGSVGSVTQADLLTVAAGEPVTHFNLDQLLEIVQSFQLDTTLAGHDEQSLRTARDLVLCSDLVSGSMITAAL